MVAIMYAPGDLRVIEVCDGPNPNGCCPRIAAGEEVPCRGRDIVLSREELAPAGLERPRIRVEPGCTVCPVTLIRGTQGLLRTYFSPFACR